LAAFVKQKISRTGEQALQQRRTPAGLQKPTRGRTMLGNRTYQDFQHPESGSMESKYRCEQALIPRLSLHTFLFDPCPEEPQ
jgi:hypothetical protein